MSYPVKAKLFGRLVPLNEFIKSFKFIKRKTIKKK